MTGDRHCDLCDRVVDMDDDDVRQDEDRAIICGPCVRDGDA